MSDDLSIPNPRYQGNRPGRYGRAQPQPQSGGMDRDTKRLVMFAGALGIVLTGLIGASALTSHHSDTPPVISPDPRPIKVRPKDPGGMKIDAAENDVFSGGSDTANAHLAPPPETPDLALLRAPAQSLPAPPPPASPPVARAEPAPGVGKSLLGIANLPAVAAPVADRAAADHLQTDRPTPVGPATARPSTDRAATEHPGNHHLMVQLAAMATEDAAHAEWLRLQRKWPDLFARRQPSYSRTERDGHVFWRVRTSGFIDLPEAKTFCEHVRTKGGGCSVADF